MSKSTVKQIDLGKQGFFENRQVVFEAVKAQVRPNISELVDGVLRFTVSCILNYQIGPLESVPNNAVRGAALDEKT